MPKASASAKAKMQDSHNGQPQYSAGMVSIIPAKPIIEPTDRSNSPPIISNAAPTARMPRNAATVPQLTTPSALNMPELPAMKANNRKTRTVPDSDPNSGRLRKRRAAPMSRTRSSDAGECGGAALGSGALFDFKPVSDAGTDAMRISFVGW